MGVGWCWILYHGVGCLFRVLDGVGCLKRVLDGCWMLSLGVGCFVRVLDVCSMFYPTLSLFYPTLMVLDGCWIDYFRIKATNITGEVLDEKCWLKHNHLYLWLHRFCSV